MLRGLILIAALACWQGILDYYELAKTVFEEDWFEDALSLPFKLPEERKSESPVLDLRAVTLAEFGRYDEALAANQHARQLDLL